MMNRRIVCAANRYNGLIIASARHFDRTMHDAIEGLEAVKAALASTVSL